MTAWLALVPALPLALALAAGARRLRAALAWLAPLALVPALLAAAFAPANAALELEWLMLGTRLGLDATGRVFLLFSALAWLVAAVYARAWLVADLRRARFFGFFLAAAGGNFGACLAQDVLTFYLFFALMTFSAWGLVLHRATVGAQRAGTVYVVIAVLGEAALLAALWLTVAEGGTPLAAAPAAVAASEWRDVIVALLLIGFGAKAGVLGLHVALPLAYGAAPVPGAAVLASAMIKAGLLGWLRFLPIGFAVPEWSAIFAALGLAAAFYGVAVGLLQREPKVILAYSSVSQMGLITFGVGLALAAPDAPALLALTLYAAHHALVKGALFLGEGLARATREAARRFTLAALVLLALVLAGAPLTSGAAAKYYLKELAGLVPWASALMPLLGAASVGTTLLLARFLWQVWQAPREHATRDVAPLMLPWVALIAAVLLLAWFVLPLERARLAAPAAFVEAAWPVALGILLAAAAARWMPSLRFALAPGDLLVPVETALRGLASLWRARPARHAQRALPRRPRVPLLAIEAALRTARVNGVALLALLALLFVLLHAVKHETGEARSYRVDRIESATATRVTFVSRYAIELTPSGPLVAPPSAQRPSGLSASSFGRGTFGGRSKPARSGIGPTYVIECSTCEKKFSRKERNTHLKPHKDKHGYPCPGRTGYLLVDTKY